MTDTLKTSLQVLAFPVAANSRTLDAFVNIDAIQVAGTVLVSLRALAFEAAREVCALRVALARIRHPQAFVLVDTLVGANVVGVSVLALAFKTSRSVHARTVGAHGWHQLALVDFFGLVCHWVDDLAWMWTAK